MKPQLTSTIFIRITALWAFSEAFLGGILHGFKVPFAGLALSLVAAICMSLLAVQQNKKGVILKATLTVIAVKFMLSPHTPPMAYLAVLVEGLAGELFFLQRKYIRTAAFALTLFCLMYSAMQHLLVLTLIFGNGFWSALDIFLNGITKTFVPKPQRYSLYIVVFYLLCYFIAGILGGWFNQKLIKQIQYGGPPQLLRQAEAQLAQQKAENISAGNKTKKNKLGLQYFIAGLLLVLYILSYTPLFSQTLLKNKVTEIVLRGILIIAVWNFLLAPLLLKWLSNWVNSFQKKSDGSLQQVLSLLPDIKSIVQVSWQLAAKGSMWQKFTSFISNTMMLIVYGR